MSTHDHAGGSCCNTGAKQAAQVAATDPVRDPVCGMTVDPSTAKGGSAMHAGLAYHFCSAGCRAKFVANPQLYLDKASPQPNASPGPAAHTGAAPLDAIYTCPMHPEVRQQGPGTCPICGMALEPEMPSLDDEENPELRDFGRRFWWTLPLTLVVLLLAMFGHYLPTLSATTRTWIELVLTTPVVLWAGWPFFVRCVQSIRNRSPNMWTLIGIGVAAAFGYSVAATLAPGVYKHCLCAQDRYCLYFSAP